MNAAGPIVQVVSGGTNSAAIAAAISGGLVGLAGIGATIWASVRNSRAENSRAHLAEKRRVYVSYLTSVNELTRMAYTPPKAGTDDLQTKAMSRALSALSEAILIGSPEVHQLAESLLSRHFDIVEATGQKRNHEEIASLASELLHHLQNAMRVDLGESSFPEPDHTRPLGRTLPWLGKLHAPQCEPVTLTCHEHSLFTAR